MTGGANTPLSTNRIRTMIGIAGVGVLLLGVGVIASLLLSSHDWKDLRPVKEESSRPSGSSSPNESGSKVVVDISGAVEKPGVYELLAGSRTGDALIAAGGLSIRADRGWVARNINLAQKVSDGIKIYVPLEPTGNVAGQRASSSTQAVGGGEASTSTISINTASAKDLEELWGVGEARSVSIIAGRPYTSIEELTTKKVLPKNVIERNRARLSL